MNIGFDAKRAFLNTRGLGNYSRTLIESLITFYPEHKYTLFTTKKNIPGPQKQEDQRMEGGSGFSNFICEQKKSFIIQPEKFIDKKISSGWRSYGITSILSEKKIDVYHGLSNELPFNIRKFKGKKIVTIHDLIFLRHPHLYPLIDRKIYNKKFKSACEHADIIIATSEQTGNDLVEFYSTNPAKIKVIYQSCSGIFHREISDDKMKIVKSKYKLPEKYLLYVGTIEERKNLLTILKALTVVKDIPLVVIGTRKAYFKKIHRYITENKLNGRVLFLKNVPSEDLPPVYSSAEIFIYPSLFEGFGIPVIEALTCKTPVITTIGGCFAEAGGIHSIYIDPKNYEQLADEIKKLMSSHELRKTIAEKGFEHSKKFLPEVIASEVMQLYTEK